MSRVLVSTPTLLPSAAPAHVLAYASEYRLAASRRRAPAGRIVAELVNSGQDDHDLTVRRAAGGAPLGSTSVVHAGKLGVLRLTLKPGRYVLYCSIADHEARGMRAVLVVSKRRPHAANG
jgi:hypothetical protein